MDATTEQRPSAKLTFENLKIVSGIFVALLIAAKYFVLPDTDCLQDLVHATGFLNASVPPPRTDQCLVKNYSKTGIVNCFLTLKEADDGGGRAKSVFFVGNAAVGAFQSTFSRKVFSLSPILATAERNASATDITAEAPDDTNDWKDEKKYLGLQPQFMFEDSPSPFFQQMLTRWLKNTSFPDLIVLGFSPPPEEEPENKNNFMNQLSSISFDLDLLAERTNVVWLLFSAPQGTPAGSKALHSEKHRRSVKNVLKSTHIKIWDVSLTSDSETGNELGWRIESQILVNYFCNKLQPKTSTLCCSKKHTVSLGPKIIIAAVIILLCLGFIFGLIKYLWEDTWEALNVKRQKLLNCISTKQNISELPLVENGLEVKHILYHTYLLPFAKCVFIFSYFYICDRTSLFEKESKFFNYEVFFGPLLLSVIIALMFRGKSTNSKPLNRDTTDEWKGWMQVVILIYHYTGASSHLKIYMHLRVLVSSYLFMTGFGNFCYYWQGGDLSFRRYCQVMLRMNLLTVVLCLVMQRSYQFYYFVPLVSFWYTVLFVVLRLPPKLELNPEVKKVPSDNDYVFAFVKLSFLFTLVTGLSCSKSAFDSIFLLPFWKFLFVRLDQDDYEWWFRWNLDKYSIIYGAAFGLVYKRLYTEQSPEGEEKAEKKSKCSVVMSVIPAIAMMLVYSLIFLVCATKQTCNQIHPFVVWVPIVGFIWFRSVSEELRSWHSTALAAAGKISLELFVCQYHIWLAGDTEGTLVLVRTLLPGLNLVFATVVYVCVASEVHNITGQVVRVLVPKENARIVANLLWMTAFFVVLSFAL